MRFTADDRLFVRAGAGISAESGLATFRGSGGLWNGYRVEEVATPKAWHANPEIVWRFYSMRRRDALAAQPNVAHLALSQPSTENRRPLLSLHTECRRRFCTPADSINKKPDPSRLKKQPATHDFT
jgi:NAD-dependent SIR2 family protein deacetylase